MRKTKDVIERYRRKIVLRMAGVLPEETIKQMIDNYTIAQSQIALVDQKVRTVLATENIPSLFFVHYLTYGRKVWATARRYSGKTGDQQIKTLRQYWAKQGLNETVLEKIEQNVRALLP
ncbi:hypothetical protein HPY86_03740 [candidate division WOR-3 bacterium]|jgi:hypothetical protein|nr:hypothetical protein [candidate division WOR-3 bacterium]